MNVFNEKLPFIFISYSHRDSAKVCPIIERLRAEGFNVWYDDGIEPGSEWDENIAEHITGCSYFIAFISGNYMNSHNCKDELNYSRDLDKERLLIYLEDVSLTSGMAMRMNRNQAIYWLKFPDVEQAYQKLFKAVGIEKTKVLTPTISANNTNVVTQQQMVQPAGQNNTTAKPVPPAQSQPKPAVNQAVQTSPQAKPIMNQTAPMPNQQKPMANQVAPVQSQKKPAVNQVLPVQPQPKPAVNQPMQTPPQAKPVMNQTAPMPSQQKPMANQVPPAQPQPKPAVNQARPVQPQPKPAVNQVPPVQPQPKPAVNQPMQTPPQAKPMMNQTASMSNQQKPMANQVPPVQNQQKPMANQAPSVQNQSKQGPNQPATITKQQAPLKQNANGKNKTKSPYLKAFLIVGGVLLAAIVMIFLFFGFLIIIGSSESDSDVEKDNSKYNYDELIVEDMIPMAEDGDLGAMYYLGTAYLEGTNGAQADSKKAIYWFDKAVAEGDIDSMQILSELYYFHEYGVECNYAKVVELGHMILEQDSNDADTMFMIGACYYKGGYGVEQDYEEAFEWYLQAANLGHLDSMLNVALCYQYGIGVEQNDSKFAEWQRKYEEAGGTY